MQNSGFGENRIVGISTQQMPGLPVTGIHRKHGSGNAAYLTLGARGMEMSDARRLGALDAETRNLRKLPAEAMVDVATLREASGETPDRCYGPARSRRLFAKVECEGAGAKAPNAPGRRS